MASTINASNTGSGGLISSGDASGVLQLQTANGVTAVTIDTSQNVGIGTTSPTAKAQIGDSTVVATNRLVFGKAQTATEGNLPAIGQQSAGAGNDLALAGTSTSAAIRFYTGASTNSGEIGTGSNTERMRIDSSGNLLVNGTTNTNNSKMSVITSGSYLNGIEVHTAGNNNAMTFYSNSSTYAGAIVLSGSTTSYTSASDYRLKENIAPMTGALNKVAQLKPVTYKWKANGSDGQGFIAHELQEVVPDCVVGDKDAVDANGNPIYQGIDTSFLVATLTAALQETKALIDQQAETINALTARVVALESK